MPVARAVVELGLVSQGFRKGLAAAGKSLNSFAARVGSIGRKITLGITLPIVAVSVGLFKLGADAVESESLFQVSMKGMADSAREWSNELSKSLGLNAFAIRKNVAQFNVMLKSFGIGEDQAFDMAKAVTQLAEDMTSFYDLPHGVAFDKIKSGLTGQTEPLEAMGISIKEFAVEQALLSRGLVETTKNLTFQQKVMGRYLAIMDATSEAQGDLARTADSPTNQLRRMRNELTMAATELSMSLMPAFRAVIKVLSKVAGSIKGVANWLQKLSPTVKVAGLAVLAFAAVIGPLLIVVGLLSASIAAFIAMLAAMATPIGLVIVAVAGLAAVIIGSLVAAIGAAMATGETMTEKFKSGFMGIVKLLDIMLGSWDGFKASMVQIAKTLVATVFSGWLVLKDKLKNLWANIVDDWSLAWMEIKETIQIVWNDIDKVVKSAISSLTSWMLKKWVQTTDLIKGTLLVKRAANLQTIEDIAAGEKKAISDAHLARLQDIADEKDATLQSIADQEGANEEARLKREKEIARFNKAIKEDMADFLADADEKFPKLSDKAKPLIDSIENAFKGFEIPDFKLPDLGKGIGDEIGDGGTKAAQNFKASFVGIEDLWKRISTGSSNALGQSQGADAAVGADTKRGADAQQQTSKKTSRVIIGLDAINRSINSIPTGPTVFA